MAAGITRHALRCCLSQKVMCLANNSPFEEHKGPLSLRSGAGRLERTQPQEQNQLVIALLRRSARNR